ncbi:mitochondrial export translocase Oxa1 [Neurospora tetrasperma FGSC 2508]|uniref:Mitochondrial export translocase Oxa1 n=1 Tax=Neurospora tetrasperma (strain FGSC 2508 / ATCC MYA-4615 / P0657) TaxID=510951 RepID=F8MAP9_NEUT8|nr:mitochondrial export translocase Oxa1 [Neurospora tetrasperma FGSC 2508]EGO60972.1 mitochondrial export translocase Oxa1 [Neurospora tetrasperma FGSC 2508]EGZ75024.1 mitochondrial export translocase Oxa1 [Neurospora tetrasperma FGSC 2509]
MLPSRGLLRSTPALGLARASFKAPSSRQFGTALPSSFPQGSRRIGGPLGITATAAASHQLLSSLRQVRYASTGPDAAVAADAAAAAAAPASSPVDAVAATPVELTGSDLLNLPEQIGFLKTLGLDYGWGVTSMMQWLTEHVYVYSGLPWWATLAAVAAIVRVAIFKPSLGASQESQKMQDLNKNPKYAAIMAKVKEASFDTTKQNDLVKYRQDMALMTKNAGINYFKVFIPFIQVPIGFGMFRLIRGMATLPVESLETGGTLWFPDLTVADPYFALPIASACLFVASMRKPIPYMAPQQARMMKSMGLVLVPVSIFATAWLPAALQWYFLVSAIGQYFQASIFHLPAFRRWVGLPELVPGGMRGPSPFAKAAAPSSTIQYVAPRTMDTTATPVDSGSILGDIKDSSNFVKEKLEDWKKKNDNTNIHSRAKEYEERRALEEHEAYLARLELKKQKQKGRKNH